MKFNYDSDRTQVVSYGGGVNSVAILALIGLGKLPKPDYIVIADTGREGQATWDYLDAVAQPYARSLGLEVSIASHDLSKVDLYAHNGDLLLPMYTTRSGKLGKLPTYCSSEWKKLVVRRWLRRRDVKQCDLWLGFAVSEIERVKPSELKWERRVFPLIDLMLSRQDCLGVVASVGLPRPPRSMCWMCPHRSNAEWMYLKTQYSGDFDKAVDLEAFLRSGDEHVFLHKQAVPLGQVDFSGDEGDTDYMQCGLGMCFL